MDNGPAAMKEAAGCRRLISQVIIIGVVDAVNARLGMPEAGRAGFRRMDADWPESRGARFWCNALGLDPKRLQRLVAALVARGQPLTHGSRLPSLPALERRR